MVSDTLTSLVAHHIDRRLVPVEHFENAPQKPVRHQHAGGVGY